eukprot:CAMPEP_0169194404 /NCGR_PEP_ID=MMETSP1016-20121227/6677_1 /TAXON_ID=342587 /ORGANISM="Karlodinium micrum, Strain CCMP2283" /LENGTH=634 /DNA_ID=CAMNT_0009270903 /DNA_START=1 /DNA_END=1902 /DNA_ORIENTATION=-
MIDMMQDSNASPGEAFDVSRCYSKAALQQLAFPGVRKEASASLKHASSRSSPKSSPSSNKLSQSAKSFPLRDGGEVASSPSSMQAINLKTTLEEEKAARKAKQLAEEETAFRGFRQKLLHKYHSIVAAWCGLDPHLVGRLSRMQFGRACHQLGYEGSVTLLWKALDKDSVGFISLYELDEPIARLLEGFAVSVWAACGSAQIAWDRHFNRRLADGSNEVKRCAPEAFGRGCKEIGFSGDVDAVYQALNIENSTVSISEENFMILKMWFARKRQPDKISAFHQHIDEETAKLRAQVAAAAKPDSSKRVAGARELTAKDKFKRLLVRSYGNFVRAWREGLDYDKNGRLDYEEFRKACSDVGYAGPRKELWKELDVDGSGVVSLGELDAPTANLLEGFYSCVMARYESWEEAWHSHFDRKGIDRVELQDFRDGCLTLGYGGNVDRLFELLDIERTKYLSFKACSWIAGGDAIESSPLWENDADFKFTGQFKNAKKLTKSQLRTLDAKAREGRLQQRRLADRDRGLMGPASPSSPLSSVTMKMNSTSRSLPSLQDPCNSCNTVNSFMSMTSVSSSPGKHRFAHSAAKYYPKETVPPPPPPPPLSPPSSPFRPRLNGRGEKVRWRDPDDMSTSMTLSRS